MKKILLLLSLLLSVGVFAQIPPLLPPPLFTCVSNNDGIGEFDLTSRIPNILEGMDPATAIVTFHETLLDSQSNINPILNPASYPNIIPFNQTVYVRKIDLTNGTVYLQNLDLVVSQNPIANAATLSFCDSMELALYGLSEANGQITGGLTGFDISYHETLIDAEMDNNQLNETYIPLINPGVQVLFARVSLIGSFCFAVTTVSLNTNICNSNNSTPTDLTASNVTDTSLMLNWTDINNPIGSSTYAISIVPSGFPPSNASGLFTQAGPYVITGLDPNACYSVYVRNYTNPTITNEWSAPLNICMPNCANTGICSQALLLNAFLDSNNNGVKDPSEVNFNNGNFVYQINDSGNNQYGMSNNGSYYIFDSNPNNSYDISFAVSGNLSTYYTSSVTQNDITITSGSGANNLYFPVANILPYVDAQVNLVATGQPRPGFSYWNTIIYKNNGVENIASGTVSFTKAPIVSILTVSQAGTTSTNDGFTYNFTNLAPNEERYININLLMPTIPTVNLGDLITNSVGLEVNDDINLSNSTSILTQTTVGSFDPNDKMEAHGGKIVHSSFTANDYLYYTIQFENTGTANAEFVRIEDLLDSKIDESTFEMISASHNVNTKRIANQLTWHFFNIDLPPTSINSVGSHGYVSFRIKPKSGFAFGNIIPNSASIYFDYNPPIITNTFNTEFVQALKNNTFMQDNIVLFPNPARNIVQINLQNSNEQIQSLVVYDLLGNEVKTDSKLNGQIDYVNVSDLSKGVYLVEIITLNKFKMVKKLVIE